MKDECEKLVKELETLYHDQAIYWRQGGKVVWMKDRDKNTRFFHAKASIRERVNQITSLRNGVGEWVTKEAQMFF